MTFLDPFWTRSGTRLDTRLVTRLDTRLELSKTGNKLS